MFNKNGATFIAFDCEFSGPFAPRSHYMVAIGFWMMTPNGEERTLRVCLKPPTPEHRFDPKCWNEFWARDEIRAKLAEWEKVAVDPKEGMQTVVEWINAQLREFPKLKIVCDCPTDATWLDYYLSEYADHAPLITFTGEYTGWPMITDDVYRGMLRTFSMWGVSNEISGMARIPIDCVATHDPVDDARDIGKRFVVVAHAFHFN